MITYILAANSEMSNDTEDKLGSINDEDMLQRLGIGATLSDAVLFSKLWKACFLNCTAEGFEDGLPVFYDQEDFDSSWAELVEIME